ncbi:Dbl homology domain-containing protein [Halteromyces radiatus]|uniref:Dbl homology domain-containing protein n=1 Tax=Halteromyces radiatus TaxID=101107 RepID=UPI0022208EC5|nr:Dbl homology domain-containing protein [Halteromyces radiatus]KAI8099470.1 Dbl homology domain-containing protein [Halteromyces radiatus]
MFYESTKRPRHRQMSMDLSSPTSDIGSTSTSSSSQSLSYYMDQHDNRYHQLMDDLSIIDDIYNTYDHDQLTLTIDNQVAYSTKNGVLKQQLVQHLIQTETQFLDDLDIFQKYFVSKLPYFMYPKNKLAFQQEDCDILFKPATSLISVHQTLLEELRQRLSIWGPTQLLSDLFYRFYDHMDTIYTNYMTSFSSTLMTLDRLHKTPAFLKFLESCPLEQLQDFGYYIRLPLTRLSLYTQTICQFTQLSEPTHPDYNPLVHICHKFKTRQHQWQNMIDNCLSHYRVYECFRLVQNSPALVTPTRRLLLHSELIHVDPNSPTDTSDKRIYILYNDLFIFCKRQKDGKLHYKGIVILDKTVLKPMDPKIVNKIYEKHQKSVQGNGGRKLSIFGSRRQNQATLTTTSSSSNSSSSSGSSTTSSTTEEFGVYGLELFFQFIMDNNVISYSNPIGGYGGASVSSTTCSDSIRRHILRTSSLEEQNLWMDHLRRVIQSVTAAGR